MKRLAFILEKYRRMPTPHPHPPEKKKKKVQDLDILLFPLQYTEIKKAVRLHCNGNYITV